MPLHLRPWRMYLFAVPAFLLALSLLHCHGGRKSSTLKASIPPKITLDEDEFKFEADIARFEQMEQDSPSGIGGIVFTGSSSIRLWETLHEDMAPLRVVNCGFGGSIIRQVSYYADRMLIPLKPRLIVLYCGENDICDEVSSHEEPLQNFKDFVAIIHHSLPETRVLYLNMKPSPLRWQYWEKYQKGNRLIEEYTRNEPLLDYLDISGSMIAKDGKPRPEIWKADSLHMNALGYEGWTAVVQPKVAQIWKEITEDSTANDKLRQGEPRE